MQADARFWAGKRVCVTGGTGFLGWNLVTALLPLAGHVRVMGLQPASDRLRALLKPLDCVYADVRDPGAVAQAVRDCDVVFHTAGTIATFGPAIQKMYDIHLEGTRNVLQALPVGARLVHTSSVTTIGASRRPVVLTEASPLPLDGVRVDYVHAKKATEDLALTAAARGSDVVVVNPGYLVGPNDYEGSVMGRFCVRCWKGKIQLVPPGGLSYVDVRDVAQGHLLAAERGCSGSRYILAGANLPVDDLVARLVAMRGLAGRPRYRMPLWLLAGFAFLAEIRGRWLQREPYPSRQQVRLCRYHWYYSSARAEKELGFHARPLDQTLSDTHAWYCEQGLLPPLARSVADQSAATTDRAAA